jgi:hypothetical protein
MHESLETQAGRAIFVLFDGRLPRQNRAPIDVKDFSRNERSVLGTQEKHRRGNLFGRADPA